MARFTAYTTLVAVLAAPASAQVPVWGQCGGIGWAGGTTCVSGAYCAPQNDWYYQCLPGAAPPVSSTKSSTSTRTSATTSVPTTTPTQTPGPAGLKYFVTFGDSYSQTGFNINSTKPNPQNPLGNPTLPGWTASGGLDWVGFMVTQFNATLTYSYNFAYGGATTDASLVTPYQPTVLSFADQVAEFTRSLAPRPAWAPWTAENTLVGVWMGVNDVGNSFYLANREQLLVRVLGRYFDLLQTLYDSGVRKFVLLSVPPTQKTPLMIANGPESNALLVAAINQYNDLVVKNLAAFKTKNAGVTSWIVDTAVPFDKAIANPRAYGAPDATCTNSNGVSCLWFDSYHPGVQVQKLVAQAVADAVGEPWFT